MDDSNYFSNSFDSQDRNSILALSFLGYKYRQRSNKLYDGKLETPINLIKLYYLVDYDFNNLSSLKKSFITHYVKNESDIEDINYLKHHGGLERKGLGIMYEYINSQECDQGGLPPFSFSRMQDCVEQTGRFNIWVIQNLHAKLFSCCPHSEFGGNFRNMDVYLPGSGSELSAWCDINDRLWELSPEVLKLCDTAKIINEKRNSCAYYEFFDMLFKYINDCVTLCAKLIKIHPFYDGNGRVSRGFLNKLFMEVGLPPVYIKFKEMYEYREAMDNAINKDNYYDLYGFYLYKICDSILELDNRLKMPSVSKDKEKNEHGKKYTK